MMTIDPETDLHLFVKSILREEEIGLEFTGMFTMNNPELFRYLKKDFKKYAKKGWTVETTRHDYNRITTVKMYPPKPKEATDA